jgi:glutaredoxin
MKKMVRVYSIPDCPYCTELKNIFTAEGIAYVDINVMLDENEQEYNDLQKIINSDDVPVIKVANQLLVPNVSFTSIRQAADITKTFLV